jgi:hypothetical protein
MPDVPVASIEAGAADNGTVQFTVTGARGADITWRFGDGQDLHDAEATQTTDHTYLGGGEFTVIAHVGPTGQRILVPVTVADVEPDPNPVPVLDSINPSELPVGPPADTVLHCIGSGFTTDSVIRFGDVDERTDFVSDSEVSTIITGGLFPSPDDVLVTVSTPAPGGGESAAQLFSFTPVEPPEEDPPVEPEPPPEDELT